MLFRSGVTSGTNAAGAAGTLGSWTFQVTTAKTLADGSYTITAVATDAAGNVSSPSSPLTVTIDTSAPAAPTQVRLAAAYDTGTIGDGYTFLLTYAITGMAEPDTDITLYAGSAIAGTTTSSATGSFSITLTNAIGSYVLSATATDPAGNVSLSSARVNLNLKIGRAHV